MIELTELIVLITALFIMFVFYKILCVEDKENHLPKIDVDVEEDLKKDKPIE